MELKDEFRQADGGKIDNEADTSDEECQDWVGVEDDIDMIDQVASKEEMKNAKARMKRSIGGRITGMFKGLFNKNKEKKSWLFKKKQKDNDRNGSVRVNQDEGMIRLQDDPDCDPRGSIYSVNLGSVAISQYCEKEDLLSKEQQLKNDVRMSTALRPLNMIESQLERNKDQCHENVDVKLDYIASNDHEDVEDITQQLSDLDSDSSEEEHKEMKDGSEKEQSFKPPTTHPTTQIQANLTPKDLQTIADSLLTSMKSLIISQFKASLKDDSTTHYGITCSLCSTSPIKGIRYKCAICIEYNLCELCEVNHDHDHIFIKIRNRDKKVPMLVNLKNMAKTIKVDKVQQEEDKQDYPRVKLDVSCVFGGSASPTKAREDILKANLVQLNDHEFLETMTIEKLGGRNKKDQDWLVTIKWTVKNETENKWPEEGQQLSLKCLSNDCYLKIADLPITESIMKPLIIQPGKTSEILVKFMIPASIRQGNERNRLTMNLVFSLYDVDCEKYVGANLPCTIPL